MVGPISSALKIEEKGRTAQDSELRTQISELLLKRGGQWNGGGALLMKLLVVILIACPCRSWRMGVCICVRQCAIVFVRESALCNLCKTADCSYGEC